MDKQERQIRNAGEAQALLGNPLFAQAFAETRAGIMEAWAGLDSKDKETAAELLLMVKCLDRVKRCVVTHIETGKLAAAEIEGRKKRFNMFRSAA